MNNYCIQCGAELEDKGSEICRNCLGGRNPAIPLYVNQWDSRIAGSPGVPLQQTAARPGKPYAWFGIFCAVASLFVVPIVFGALAVFSGYFALTKGERKLGWTSIILGIVLATLSILIVIILDSPTG